MSAIRFSPPTLVYASVLVMAPRKRDPVLVDLTDDDVRPQKRRAIDDSRPASSRGSATPNNGSQTPSSQTWDDEHEVLDLTQEPEGPEKELYGTLSQQPAPKNPHESKFS